MGAMVALEAERIVPGALITSYPDALWWAFVFVTTIGYGVYYPVTMTGRLITVVLVLAGIAIIGVITGSCVAWVIREVGINDEKDASVTKGQADKLERKLEMLSDKVSDLNRRMRSLLATSAIRNCLRSSGHRLFEAPHLEPSLTAAAPILGASNQTASRKN